MLEEVDFTSVNNPVEVIASNINYTHGNIHRLSGCDFDNCSGIELVELNRINNMIVSLNTITNTTQDNTIGFFLSSCESMAFRYNQNIQLSGDNQGGLLSVSGDRNSYRSNTIQGSGENGFQLL